MTNLVDLPAFGSHKYLQNSICACTWLPLPPARYSAIKPNYRERYKCPKAPYERKSIAFLHLEDWKDLISEREVFAAKRRCFPWVIFARGQFLPSVKKPSFGPLIFPCPVLIRTSGRRQMEGYDHGATHISFPCPL